MGRFLTVFCVACILSLVTLIVSWHYTHFSLLFAPRLFHFKYKGYAAWDLFSKFKSVVYTSSEIRDGDLSCISVPNSPIDWNSSVCLLYVLSPLKRSAHNQVSAALHFTADRLPHLQETCSRWGGPVIGVLFLFPDQLSFLAPSIVAAQRMQQDSINCARYLELYVALDIRPPGESYPVNLLRNIGLLAASTPQVVSLDADFIPSVDGSAGFTFLDGWTKIRSAIVLPAFHYTEHGYKLGFPIPRNKAELLAMLRLGLAAPMHPNHRSQHFTNYAAWPTAVSPYPVVFGLFYEPYVVLSMGRRDPLFSHLFLKSGNDKCSFHFELHAAGYDYFVHPTQFLFHIPHSTQSGHWRSHNGDYELAWVNTKKFLVELQAKYMYEMPFDPEVAAARNNSRSPLPNLVAPALHEWVPSRISTRPTPICLHNFQSSFELNIESITEESIPSSILERMTSMPSFINISCEGTKDCEFMAPVGYSCAFACSAFSRNCSLAGIALMNNCGVMPNLRNVWCPKGCFKDQGFDLPAVPASGVQESQCLTNKWPLTCTGQHHLTSRLCVCVK